MLCPIVILSNYYSYFILSCVAPMGREAPFVAII